MFVPANRRASGLLHLGTNRGLIMIEKLSEYKITNRDGSFINVECNTKIINTLVRKINNLVDVVNELQKHEEQHLDLLTQLNEMRLHQNEEPAESVQKDHYWYKQQERYKAALVLIRNLSGVGMSYHDMCIESREIARWALDPDYKPLLIGRYSKDDQELFDTLRETEGGDNE